jgi:hypothetical protein
MLPYTTLEVLILEKKVAVFSPANILYIIGWLGVASSPVSPFKSVTAVAQEVDCDMATIKAGNGPDAIEANFIKLNACLKKLQSRFGPNSVPEGAVMAFDLDQCPVGWELFVPAVGRFVLGGLPPATSPAPRMLPYPKAPIMSMKGSLGGVSFQPIFMPPVPITPDQSAKHNFFALMSLPNLGSPAPELAPYAAPEVDVQGQRLPTYYLTPPYVALLVCKKQLSLHAPLNR